MNCSKSLVGAAVALSLVLSGHAHATIRISEWMYNGTDEFIELTNLATSPIDMTGWSYSDDGRAPGEVDLSLFGQVGPGESMIISEQSEGDFRALWDMLPVGVKVLGGNSANLGRGDEINIYDGANALVDRLTYGDQDFPGTIRTSAISGNPSSPAVLVSDTVGQPGDWVLSTIGDRYGSYASLAGDVGNPGVYVDAGAAVPEPASILLSLLGICSLVAAHRCR